MLSNKIDTDKYYAVINADGTLIIIETDDEWFEGLTEKYPDFEVVSGLELESYLAEATEEDDDLLRTDADENDEDFSKEEKDLDYEDEDSF